MPRYLGLDGCKSGWAVVTMEDDPQRCALSLAPSFSEGLSNEFDIAAVDIPMGLPERIEGPGRAAEQAARGALRALAEDGAPTRQSSVFSIPSRSAIHAEGYEAVCCAARQTSEPSKALSKQCYNILPKIREADAWLRENGDVHVFEAHPELAFARLAGHPMRAAKKTRQGREERAALLRNAGYTDKFLSAAPPRGIAVDDFLDACIMALTAKRIHEGVARPHPEHFDRDAHGLRIAIWA